MNPEHRFLLLDPSALPLFLAAVNKATPFSEMQMNDADDEYWSGTWMSRYYRPYNVRDGVLQIPVRGSLLGNYDNQIGGWVTGFGYIDKALKRGVSDPEVRGIAMMIDSPGGTVSGTFETTALARAVSDHKPVRSFVKGSATSAAYALASGARRIDLNPSSRTGSIGVVLTHTDLSKLYDDIGIKVSYVYAGKHKVDGNPMEPLPEHVRDEFQAQVDKTYSKFVSTVAQNRLVDERIVQGTEARVYDAEDSIQVGFADAVGDLDEAMNAFQAEVNPIQHFGGFEMTHPAAAVPAQTFPGYVMPQTAGLIATVPAAAPPAPAVVPTAAPPAAAPVATGPTEEQRVEFRAEGLRAERNRFVMVMEHPAYKGREMAALVMLKQTDMTGEQVTAVLEATPLATAGAVPEQTATPPAPAAQPRNHFTEAMKAAQEANGLPAGGGEDTEAAEQDKTPVAKADGFYASLGIAKREG